MSRIEQSKHRPIYGSLFFASAQNFEHQLPHPTPETSNAVVILDLRGQRHLDSTTLDMFTEYAQKLERHNSRLMLAGVEDPARQTLGKTGKLATIGTENVFEVSEHYHESVLKAQASAEEWSTVRNPNPQVTSTQRRK